MSCCKNRNLIFKKTFYDDIVTHPNHYYRLKCTSCGWEHEDGVILFNSRNGLVAPDAKINKYKCKLLGHRRIVPTFYYTSNTLTGIIMHPPHIDDIDMCCTRCGKGYGSMARYDRLFKVKALLEKSKIKISLFQKLINYLNDVA